MTKRTKREAPARVVSVKTTLTHLQLVPCPEQYARLADLQVQHSNKLFPCHSSALAVHSKVLCTMFDDVAKEEWASGVAAVLAGHSLKDVEMYLTFVHSPGETIDSIRTALDITGDMMGVAELAHKLDSPLVLDGIDASLSDNIDDYTEDDPKDHNVPLFWLPTVQKLNMPKTKAACTARVLDILLNESQVEEGGDRMELAIADLPGCSKELWEALSPETLLVLLQAVVRERDPDDHEELDLDTLDELCQ